MVAKQTPTAWLPKSLQYTMLSPMTGVFCTIIFPTLSYNLNSLILKLRSSSLGNSTYTIGNGLNPSTQMIGLGRLKPSCNSFQVIWSKLLTNLIFQSVSTVLPTLLSLFLTSTFHAMATTFYLQLVHQTHTFVKLSVLTALPPPAARQRI